MRELLPGLFHWTATHPKIGIEVSSYWIEDGGVLIDPLVPVDVGLDWFADRPLPPSAIVLSNRHHYRESGCFAERFGCSVHVPRSGLHEFTHGEVVVGYDPDEDLPGGLRVFEIDAICPDDMALHAPSLRAIAFADGVVRGGPHGARDELGFVPDSLMDDPERTKRGLLEACSRVLAELEFAHVLLAHGDPIIDSGRAALEDLVRSGGRTAFEF